MTFDTSNTRHGVGTWTSEQDVPTRTQFDANFHALDVNTPLLTQGIESALPPQDSTQDGQFYFATDTGRMWFNPGTGGWRTVGGKVTDHTATSQTIVDPVTGSVHLTMDSAGNVRRPGVDTETLLTLPGGTSNAGGTWGLPGFIRSAEGLIVMQGLISLPGQVSIAGQMPRPRDLRDHLWNTIFLQGSTGLLTLGLAGSGAQVLSLDGVIYFAE